MDIGPADLPVTPIREDGAVHRVEREAEARDLGQHQSSSGEGRKKKPAPVPPSDEVEISTEPAAETGPVDPCAEEGSEPPEHRLDITA